VCHQKFTIENVIVGKTEVTLAGKGNIFRGGPRWPDFETQVEARLCRGGKPVPVDTEPKDSSKAKKEIKKALWCGPAVGHFGHQIADFGMRIAASAHFSEDEPLLFSVKNESDIENIPDFFYKILSHLGVSKDRVFFVSQPVCVGELSYYPQAERMGGGGPSPEHLDFMEKIIPPYSGGKDIDTIYVSRSRFCLGGIAGESYFDSALSKSGVLVIHPELIPLDMQINIYRRAKNIIFSEGSAIHTIQLLGRTGGNIYVVSRRKGAKIAANSLLARADSVDFVDNISHNLFGLSASGAKQESKGTAILDAEKTEEFFAGIIPDLKKNWERSEFEAVQKRDIGDWFEMVNLNRGDGVNLKFTLDMMISSGFEDIARNVLNEKLFNLRAG